MAYVRTVRTASGARAVQIVHGSRRGSRTIEHVGSAHDDAELEALKAAARQRLAGGQAELDLGLEPSFGVVGPGGLSPGPSGRPLEIASSRMGPLWDGLCGAYDALGFDRAVGRDEVFRQLVLARIIEPTSKLDSLRVLAEVGVDAPSYRTVNRRASDHRFVTDSDGSAVTRHAISACSGTVSSIRSVGGAQNGLFCFCRVDYSGGTRWGALRPGQTG